MAYLNVYQSGYYHRKGKPGQYNCHPGDLYPTREAAVADVDPDAAHLYMGTYFVAIPVSVLGNCNPSDSVPTPLSVTRRELRVPSHIEGMRPLAKAVEDWPVHGSLETSANEAVDIEPPNVVAYRREQRFYDEPEDLTLGHYSLSRCGSGEEGR